MERDKKLEPVEEFYTAEEVAELFPKILSYSFLIKARTGHSNIEGPIPHKKGCRYLYSMSSLNEYVNGLKQTETGKP